MFTEHLQGAGHCAGDMAVTRTAQAQAGLNNSTAWREKELQSSKDDEPGEEELGRSCPREGFLEEEIIDSGSNRESAPGRGQSTCRDLEGDRSV